jgi:hypothetical protein
MTSPAVGQIGPPSTRTTFGWARATPLVVYGLTRVGFWLNGGGFSTALLGQAFQLLDPSWLAANPLGSAWRLHMQPPLFNLFVGIVLRWSPLDAAFTFQVVYVLCGLVMIAALFDLLLGLGATPLTAAIGASVVALDPILLGYENVLSYEYPVAMLLVVSSWGLLRYARTRQVWAFSVFLGSATAATMTRSLLHPVWLLAGVAFVLVLCWPASWRVVGALTAIAFLFVGGWMVKNQVLVGTPTLSSWFGMNLERSVLAPFPESRLDSLIEDGDLSGAAKVLPFSRYDEYAPFIDHCRSRSPHPDLASIAKRNGQPNFNAECFVPVYEQAQEIAIDALKDRPGGFIRSRGAAALLYVTRDDAPFAPEVPGLQRDGFRLLTLPVTVDTSFSGWWITPFEANRLDLEISLLLAGALLYAIALGVVSAVNLARQRGDRPAEIALVFIAFTVAFVSFSSIFFEMWEQTRLRVVLDPLLLGLATMGIAAVLQRLRRVAARSPSAAR